MNEDEARDRDAEEKRIAAPHAAALFQEHADWLRRYVRRLAGSRSLPPSLLDPDDVVQEAFVQLLRHNWDEPIRNPGAWLCVVVRNQVTKAAQQHRHFIDDDPAAHIEVGTAGWSSVPRQASTEEVQAARAAVDAIARLPGNQQVATYLSRVQGWPHADIAAFLGCSTSAAGVHVFRGTHTVGAEIAIGSSIAAASAMMVNAGYSLSGYIRVLAAVVLAGVARRLAAVVLAGVVLAAVAVVLLISGVPWWVAVLPVTAPVGATLVIAAVVWLCSVFTGWLDDHQRWKRRAERARHDRAARREADGGP
jgi:RNA polymerase sigma factor (sigma-70 family)